MNGASAASKPNRSTFVTAVAWIFIVLSGLGVLVLLLQNVIWAFLPSMDNMQHAMNSGRRGAAPVPPAVGHFFIYMRLFLVLGLIMSIIHLVSAIGLLMRKNWARILFIALLAIGILGNIVGLVFQLFFRGAMLAATLPPNAPHGVESGMQIFSTVALIVGVVFAVGFSVLFGWIIKRLLSAPIKAEFV